MIKKTAWTADSQAVSWGDMNWMGSNGEIGKVNVPLSRRGGINGSGSGPHSDLCTKRQTALKLSSERTCSTLQASAAAVSSLTPSSRKKADSTLWRS